MQESIKSSGQISDRAPIPLSEDILALIRKNATPLFLDRETGMREFAGNGFSFLLHQEFSSLTP